MTTPDRRSDKLLDSLRGYTRRQPWVKEDTVILQYLFDQLDGAHQAIRELEFQHDAMVEQHRRDRAAYERRIDYLEYRVKEEQSKGVLSYLKFLVAPCR